MGRVFDLHYTTSQKILRITVYSALLAAISIVTGKYLAFNLGEVLRFSFENLPIIFAGMLFGPIVGALTGVVADLVGCLLVGYAINPIITVGACAIGAISGIYKFLPNAESMAFRILYVSLTVAASHIVGSVIIKTFGLAAWYDMPVIILMLWRLLNYLIVGAVEGFILYHLTKNKLLVSEIKKLSGGKRK